MMYKKIKLPLISVILALFGEVLFAESGSFQISPPPIAYPYFEEGKTDYKTEPMFININSTEADLSLTGGGVNFIGRHANSKFLAFDIQSSIAVLSGQMPGVTPMYYSTSYYYTPAEKANVTMTSWSTSLNMEIQLIKEDEGSLIVFFGPTFVFTNMTMSTPYSITILPPHSNAGEVHTGFTDKLTMRSKTNGAQFGIQSNLAVGDGLSISPFYMMSTTSGTVSIMDLPGNTDADTTRFTADISRSTTTSFGMDIIIDEISIGTILQNIKQDENSNINIMMFRFGYHY